MARKKGMKGRKATTFKPHNKVACKPPTENSSECSEDASDKTYMNPTQYKRLPQNEYKRIVLSPVQSEEKYVSQHAMLLRPLAQRSKGKLDEFEESVQAELKSNPFCEVDGYRLVHLRIASSAIQAAALAQQREHPSCSGLLIALAECEIKRGAGVEEVFGCPVCHYKSSKKALFKEIPQQKPYRNPCELNVALQLALHNTSISTVGAQRLPSCLNLTSPTTDNLQKAANRVGPVLEQENERDMSVKRKIVKDTLQARGMPPDTPIHAEYDRQYNNPLRNSRKKTPFAPASQSRDVLVENATHEKYIIGFHHTNKLCSKRNVNCCTEVRCSGNEGCHATVDKAFNIGNEEDGGEKVASKVLDRAHPLRVSHLTTDADGKGCQGFNNVMKKATGADTENLSDEQHLLNRALCRAVTNTEFSSDMFPAARTATFKRLLVKRFAEDISHRVQAEISAFRQALKHNETQVVPAMRDCVPCILNCYSGDHRECWKKSFVCKRKKHYSFPFLPAVARGSLSIMGVDRGKLTKLIMTRTCEKQMRATRFGTSTQKAEAMNSAFKTTNPKQCSTYSRNARFRDHSAIHMVNNGPGESIALKMAALGLKPSLSSISILKRLQRRRDYYRQRCKSQTVRCRRASLRIKRYRLHEKQRRCGEISEGYTPNQLIPELTDHTYTYTRGISRSTICETSE